MYELETDEYILIENAVNAPKARDLALLCSFSFWASSSWSATRPRRYDNELMIQQIVFIVPFLSGRASGCQIRASDLRSIRMKKTKIEKKK